MAPPGESLAPSQIEDKLEAANQSFRSIVQETNDLMAKLGQTGEKNQRYRELKAELSQTLPRIEEQVRKLQVSGIEV